MHDTTQLYFVCMYVQSVRKTMGGHLGLYFHWKHSSTICLYVHAVAAQDHARPPWIAICTEGISNLYFVFCTYVQSLHETMHGHLNLQFALKTFRTCILYFVQTCSRCMRPCVATLSCDITASARRMSKF